MSETKKDNKALVHPRSEKYISSGNVYRLKLANRTLMHEYCRHGRPNPFTTFEMCKGLSHSVTETVCSAIVPLYAKLIKRVYPEPVNYFKLFDNEQENYRVFTTQRDVCESYMSVEIKEYVIESRNLWHFLVSTNMGLVYNVKDVYNLKNFLGIFCLVGKEDQKIMLDNGCMDSNIALANFYHSGDFVVNSILSELVSCKMVKEGIDAGCDKKHLVPCLKDHFDFAVEFFSDTEIIEEIGLKALFFSNVVTNLQLKYLIEFQKRLIPLITIESVFESKREGMNSIFKADLLRIVAECLYNKDTIVKDTYAIHNHLWNSKKRYILFSYGFDTRLLPTKNHPIYKSKTMSQLESFVSVENNLLRFNSKDFDEMPYYIIDNAVKKYNIYCNCTNHYTSRCDSRKGHYTHIGLHARFNYKTKCGDRRDCLGEMDPCPYCTTHVHREVVNSSLYTFAHLITSYLMKDVSAIMTVKTEVDQLKRKMTNNKQITSKKRRAETNNPKAKRQKQ